MKHFFSSTLLRQGMVMGLIGLFFSGIFYLASSPKGSKSAVFAELLRENEEVAADGDDADRVFTDRPDQALEQELALTRDPVTGTVPRQRLLAAARYNETMLAAQTGQRPNAGALSNANWTERGPTNVAGRVRGLLVDPSDPSGNTIWAGSAGGGLWKGTKATSSNIQWSNVNSFLTNLAVTTIAAGPTSRPSVMYCGTGEGFFNVDAIQGAGIWKSMDGGSTWKQLTSTNNTSFAYVQKVVVHPISGDVYAATRTGLWRSQDEGSTWSAVLSTSVGAATSTNRVADIEIAADNTLFAALGIFSTDGIYRSATGDPGSWIKLNTLTDSGLPTTGYQRIELACAPSDANRVYALFQSSDTGTPLLNIFRSVNKGDTWTAMARPGATATEPNYDYTRGQAWYGLAAAVSPADANALYVGGIDLWFTSNAGKAKADSIIWDHESAWNVAPSSIYYVHADHHAIAFVPTTIAPANKAYFGSDGGVTYSADASISNANEPQFSQRNTGFNVTQLYALAMHPTNFNYFLAGAQDNGTQRFTNQGANSTTTVTGGDGGLCAIDQDNPTVQFTSYVYNQYRRSLNGGSSFTNFNISASLGSFINPWEYDSQANILYAAYTTDTYLAWTNAGNPTATTAVTIKPSLGIGAGKITHIAVSPLTQKRIYVGTNSGRVLLVDSAHTLTPLVRSLRSGTLGTSVSCIAVDPTNENHLLVTYSNYGIVSVYETRDANAATPTWNNVEGSLPDMPVRWALIDPHNPARAMLATEMGVYSTELLSASATVWTPASSGLAYTRVDMLRYRPGDQLVAAATHGRGLFTSDVFFTTALAAKPRAADLFTTAYPNPFNSELNLDLGPTANRTSTAVYLADALERRVFTTTVQPTNGTLHFPVPASMAPGNYTLVVSQAGRQTSRRVTKQ